MSETYLHSVSLDRDKCTGCTTCLKRCPTEAIRIRHNSASILHDRCIDCGECIKVCPHHAKVALTDPIEIIKNFKYAIALPAPTLYAQFQGVHKPEPIIAALFRLGFDDVFEVARAAEIVSYAISKALREENRPRPVISSACPAVLRLIQIHFPALLDNVIDFISPMEAAAKIAKEEYAAKHGVEISEIGAFFISPCAAKMTAVKAPIGQEKSYVDGVIAIKDVYKTMRAEMHKGFEPLEIERASAVGIKWAVPGGEADALGIKSSLCVDGIENVKNVLEQIENARIRNLMYFEGLACVNGCLGGPLTVENSFVAKNRLRNVMNRAEQKTVQRTRIFETACETLRMTEEIEPNNIMQLEGTMKERIRMSERINELEKSLPGLDCGSCGSPTCRALAWDIAHGYANELNCIFKLNDRISSLAAEMVSLGASTRFNTLQDTARLKEMQEELGRDSENA
ncbi:MAG: 4Fe-4S binding protein [Clostridia bacterium]|nr:4Fe-4S binding protein [Clostridia bacterium]MBQ6858440.1 4Fe-4S binding protein [Clostridia bacterium]MBQ7051642.1 4Fe-4S binding protein [Clostridia bacterium]